MKVNHSFEERDLWSWETKADVLRKLCGTWKTRVTESQLRFFIAISKGMSKKPIL